ncbi:MAG: ZIP family metal transporter [Thermoanaerobaculaceae bacterium]|nr:ZIP family metal transporter [Thermoanaerobaculaceae bacterium]
MALLIGTVTLLAVLASTLAGGAVPLRFERHSRMLRSFSAGTLVGLALLELIPAAIEGSGGDPQPKLLVVLGAFLVTMLLDKLHILHPHSHRMDAECPPEEHVHRPLAMHGAVGLLVHSAVDGLALAAALQEAPHTAVAVGLALAAHKFADGLTTVSLVLSHHHRRAQAVRLLAGNAGLLLVGFAAGIGLALDKSQLGTLLLVMAGFFLYLGASDLIPSVTGPLCRKRDVLATACGMAVIALVATLAH